MKTKNYWICNDSQGIYLYCGLKKPVLVDNIFTTDSEKEFNDFLDYLKTERVGNENFYLSVTDIRTIVSKNNTQYDQLYHKMIKEIK